ncbi:TPA: hypothetical protein UM521_000328 [Stenotrophomonas maltophilia]|uniref:hypothetical protein n=1 Tax=Stenotrophomonas maltophilia TaxID=40324 RepID=UPI0021C96260|nr:hypothetical protein [Stenotrophomonas maltophilia]MCU0996859.1 hypothetical protein [Stenotrophomonas maltophilia]HEL4191531.1 hypothetical protein [Stenotrophomonas maltophilia]HEL4214018.1 hypothetical protein [Stenotrophomonas maltophilia]HEL4269964.1 hypothetical protein [Stenotrophomonas maltophilia]HEL4301135.1 hypothetical protein [Stenotrophomonas maltophilia]
MAATDFTYFASSTVRIAHISAISDVIDNGPEAGSRRYQVNIIVSGITLSEAYAFEPGASQARSEIMDAMEG